MGAVGIQHAHAPVVGGEQYEVLGQHPHPVGGRARHRDGGGGGQMTLRRALEMSRNLVTAHLLDGGIAPTPAESLDKICQLAMEAQIYQQCERFYPFILGSQPVRVIDMAAFYAAIANTPDEAIKLIEAGFDYVTGEYHDGGKLFRKRK